MTTKTIAYLRVSTDKQADRGVSLDAQRAKVKAYAELYDLELLEVIVDAGESAKSLDRPGLKRALGMLKAGQAEALLVVKLDRLTRSVVDLGTLVERYFAPGKAALLSVGEQIDTRSAAGRLVLNVLASVSQWEREAIGERTAIRSPRVEGIRTSTSSVSSRFFQKALPGSLFCPMTVWSVRLSASGTPTTSRWRFVASVCCK